MTKEEILQDHKRQRKIFIPPFKHILGGQFQETSWVKTMLPELLWIALIQDYYGPAKGVALITSFTRLARKSSSSDKKRMFATTSSYGEMTGDEQSRLQSEIAASGELVEIQKALLPLITFYPECPLRFLFLAMPSLSDAPNQILETFKASVTRLYDKASKGTTMVQATAVWLAFDSEILKVAKGLALASFPEIEKYPQTKLSQKVAASIRASMHMFFVEPHYTRSSHWPRYFWNRGLEIDQCYFRDTSDE